MMKFKTIIYGDSYVEPLKSPAQLDEYIWIHHYISKVEGVPLEDLANHRVPYPTYFNKGVSGSNIWMAYCELLKDIETIKPSNVIFAHTCVTRAPLEDPQDARNSFTPDILPVNELMAGPTRKFLKSWYKHCLAYRPFHYNFIPFVGESIFYAIERLAKKNNINLIHLIPFKGKAQPVNNFPYENIVNEYPIVYGLQDVSQSECGSMEKYFDIMQSKNCWLSDDPRTPTEDSRRCHMNMNNNMALADVVYNLKSNEVINFAERATDTTRETWARYNTNTTGFQ